MVTEVCSTFPSAITNNSPRAKTSIKPKLMRMEKAVWEGDLSSGDFNAMCVEKNLAIAKNAIDLIPSHVVIYVPTPKNKKAHTWR